MRLRKIAWSNTHVDQWTSLNQAASFFYLDARLTLVIIQTEKPVTTNGWQQTNKKFAIWHESVIYSWQFKYVNAIHTVLCISNGLICPYITGIHDKRIVTSCTTWYLSKTIRVFWLLCSIVSVDNCALIHVADNL